MNKQAEWKFHPTRSTGEYGGKFSLLHEKPESFTTSKTDRHLLSQTIRQIISVIITNTCVFAVFKTKCELKCQYELFF